MASYQIPQFLDSGDKILGPMNIRQFAYALGGFLLAVAIYSIFQNAVPGIGPYAAIPAAPVLLLALFLALGKYNGRDSEVYVLKIIIYFTKPRLMRYRRQPEYKEIEAKAAEWTETKILGRWNASLAATQAITKSGVGFQQSDKSGKVSLIRGLGNQVDTPTNTLLGEIKRRELEVASQQDQIRQMAKAQRQKTQYIPVPLPANSKPASNDFNPNFFDNPEKK